MAKAQDGTMDADEFRTIVEMLDTTQRGISRLVGVDDRTVRRWADPDDPIQPSRSTEILLRMMVWMKLSPERVEQYGSRPVSPVSPREPAVRTGVPQGEI